MGTDRIKEIKKLQGEPFKAIKRQSVVINNFYSIITIITICISVIFYNVYIVPAQKAKAQRELKEKQHQEYLDMRAKQIALSHKLNKPTQKEETNDK
jgi:hypothetical protein